MERATDLEWLLTTIRQTETRESLDYITECVAHDIKARHLTEPYAAEILRSAIRRQREVIESTLTPEPEPAKTE